MDTGYDIVVVFLGNLNDNKSTYEQIGKIYQLLKRNHDKRIALDMGKVTFVSANLFAVLGACLESTVPQNRNKVFFTNVNSKITSLMARNKFGRYFNINAQEDKYESCIDYAVFKAETEQLEEFERYIMLQIFNHREIPEMSSDYKNRIIDNFLEIFNNVIDHADAENVYVCGQFFPKSHSFVFSIVDIGLTFSEKIGKHFRDNGLRAPINCIEWALKLGNTTKTNSPGGLGLTTLLEFLTCNKGAFSIVSNIELYEYSSKGQRTRLLKNLFPGTIVTIRVNLNDSNWYLLDADGDETIVF